MIVGETERAEMVDARWQSGRFFGYEGRRWECYWWFVGWSALSLGMHVSLMALNFELHLPFGFIRAGRAPRREIVSDDNLVLTLNWGRRAAAGKRKLRAADDWDPQF